MPSQFDETQGVPIPIEGLEKYVIYPTGKIISHLRKTPKELAIRMDSEGYLRVGLWNGITQRTVTYGIHRLLMRTFKHQPGCESLVVDHIDGNRSNNALDNLRWCTVGENNHYAAQRGAYAGENHGRAKLDDEAVLLIRKLLKRGIPKKWIGQAFDVDQKLVAGIESGEYWAHVKDSTKASMIEGAKFLVKMSEYGRGTGIEFAAMDVINKWKAEGNWPLEEK